MKKVISLLFVLLMMTVSVSALSYKDLQDRNFNIQEEQKYISFAELSDNNAENVIKPVWDPVRRRNLNPIFSGRQ